MIAVVSLIFKKSSQPAFPFGMGKQVDELLHTCGSAVDGAPRDPPWEAQTYIHFQDSQGVTMVIKPEHRVEDILTLACKVTGFAAEM